MFFLIKYPSEPDHTKRKLIRLLAKPLWSPSAVYIHLSSDEKNLIAGKFRQAKNDYGLNRIRTKAERNKRNVDCEHHIGAQPGQVVQIEYTFVSR